jgi:hypothetical protein
VRPGDFKENRPPEDMGRDFSQGRRFVVGAQTQPAMSQQQRRQGARNKQHVVEPIMKKRNVAMRLDEPAIGRVQRATGQKKRIENVAESLHSRARIIKPKPKPSNNFNSKTFVKITGFSLSPAGQMSSRFGLPCN